MGVEDCWAGGRGVGRSGQWSPYLSDRHHEKWRGKKWDRVPKGAASPRGPGSGLLLMGRGLGHPAGLSVRGRSPPAPRPSSPSSLGMAPEQGSLTQGTAVCLPVRLPLPPRDPVDACGVHSLGTALGLHPPPHWTNKEAKVVVA